ncbi:MAG: hypothetical protein MI810_03925 [Flavobacteriales bacterium]|jgi:hypothetical protein|nr:hypothetical protein [Flavobacteriales bacterium]
MLTSVFGNLDCISVFVFSVSIKAKIQIPLDFEFNNFSWWGGMLKKTQVI